WRDAWMFLIPSQNWALKGAGFTLVEGRRTEISHTYGAGSTGLPVLSSCQYTDRYKKSNTTDVYIFTFNSLGPRTSEESEYTLTAFGLPEPGQPSSEGTGSKIHYWLIGGAMALF